MAGYVYKPKYAAKDGSTRESNTYWIGYSVGGKKYRESAKTTRKREAEDLLARRLVARGQAPAQRVQDRTTFESLCELIRDDYTRNGRRSLPRLERSIRHLSREFKGWTAGSLDEVAANTYISKRLRAGAAPATVNREVAALKRMLRLGYQLRLVERMPSISQLAENNARKGFFEEADLQRLLRTLPLALRPLAEAAYITGWRISELLSRDWRHVDFDGGWLILEDSKNGEGRQFPMTHRLRRLLENQRDLCRATEKRLGTIIPAVFFRPDGRYAGGRIRNPHKAWKAALKRVDMGERIFHDFRRTAVRNLVRAGVPEKVAMEATGHKTRAVFDRYNIVDEKVLKSAASMLDALHTGDKGEEAVL